MTSRLVGTVLVIVAVLSPAAASATDDLPAFHIQAPTNAVADETLTVSLTPVDGSWLYGHPLDQIAAVFRVEDLDEHLRPTASAEPIVRLEPTRTQDDGFTDSVRLDEGRYAVVPYPDIDGPLPAELAGDGAVIVAVDVASVTETAAGPTAWVLLAILLVSIGVPVLGTRWIRRREDEVDDFHERDFRDPPTLGGVWPNGSGGGGLG